MRGDQHVVLKWKPSDYFGGSRNGRYNVFLSVNHSDYELISEDNIKNHARIQNMTPGNHLSFQIQASNENMVSPMSEPYEFLYLTVPATPEVLFEDLAARTNTSVKLTWNESTFFGGAE